VRGKGLFPGGRAGVPNRGTRGSLVAEKQVQMVTGDCMEQGLIIGANQHARFPV